MGLETVELLDRGYYEVDEVRVDIGVPLAMAVLNTVEYTNRDDPPELPQSPGHQTAIDVRNETTLAAAARLAAEHSVAVLNFASAKNPGGGFLNGSRAQEESLAMSSGLYPCLLGREMYDYHRPTRGGMYTPWAIYSPGVPVIRNDDGELLAEPYEVGFITSPAVNAGVVLDRDRSLRSEVTEQMRLRIERVLRIAAHHQHDALVLGAWGCGVFRNDPEVVARLFATRLRELDGMFRAVTFAVLDWSAERRFIGPFEVALAAS